MRMPMPIEPFWATNLGVDSEIMFKNHMFLVFSIGPVLLFDSKTFGEVTLSKRLSPLLNYCLTLVSLQERGWVIFSNVSTGIPRVAFELENGFAQRNRLSIILLFIVYL